MEKLSMCRVCLVKDIRLRSIVDTHLQEMYESLVLVPFETKDRRPILVCYICRARLQNCYELRKSCLRSEELFTQMLNYDELESVTLQKIDKKRLTMHNVVNLSMGPVLQMSADNVGVKALTCVDVKVEKIDFSDIDEGALEENSVYDNIQSADADDDPLIIVKEEQSADTTKDIQLVPPQDELGASLLNTEDNQLLPAVSEELEQEAEVVNMRRGQRTGRVRTRGGGSTSVRARDMRRVGRVRTRGGRGAVTGMALAHDTSFTFYKSIVPNVAQRPAEGMYDPLLFGERLESPMHIKRPRLCPKSDAVSPRSSTNAVEAPSSITSPVQCVEGPEPTTTPRSVRNKRPFSVYSQDIQMKQSPSTSASAVPSPAQFIEYGGRSSMPNIVQPENIPQKRSRILNDYDIENNVNFGSEGESDSEDEVFPSFVPRSERMFFATNDDAEDEDVETSPHSPALSYTTILSDSATSVMPVEAINYGVSAGPQRFIFDWKNFPQVPIPPKERREVFLEAGGPMLDPLGQARPSPEAIFTRIWDRAIMRHIVDETNRYATEELSKALESLGPRSRLHRWIPTDIDELYVYFGVILAMGSCIKSNIKEYWHCDGSICDTPNFAKYMSYNRFILLNKFLHFAKNDGNTLALSPSEAKISKIKPIVEHLNHKFQILYKLNRNICVDESLTQWKGWLSINQFIKNKAASVGVKTYEVCDAKSGYLWRFEIHSGQKESTTEPPSPISGIIPGLVVRLLQGLENQGHCVWMDNYYNSPALARTLKTMGFDCVGTLRTSRQFVPPQLASLKKGNMVVGEIQGCTSGDVDILVWRDQSKVAMISTYHGNAVQNVNGTIKPIVVLDYNLCMGGVDRKDQKLAMFPIERKRTRVWYKKLFKRLLNVSVLNSFILSSESPVPEQPETRITSHRGFRTELINSLLKKKVQPIVSATTARVSGTTFSEEYFSHLPKQYNALPGRRGEKLRRVCVVCHKRIHTYCPGCNATLCLFDCFARYHRP